MRSYSYTNKTHPVMTVLLINILYSCHGNNCNFVASLSADVAWRLAVDEEHLFAWFKRNWTRLYVHADCGSSWPVAVDSISSRNSISSRPARIEAISFRLHSWAVCISLRSLCFSSSSSLLPVSPRELDTSNGTWCIMNLLNITWSFSRHMHTHNVTV